MNTLIDRIEEIYSPNKITNETIKDSSKVITAIEIGKLLLQKVGGGKLMVFNTSTDWLKAFNKNNDNINRQIYSTEEYLKDIGQLSSKYQICIDIYQAQLDKESKVMQLQFYYNRIQQY